VREWLRERARAYEARLEQKASALANKQTDGLPADHAKRAKAAVAVADSEVDLHAAMRALERRCRALELELQAAKKHKPVAKREAP
jgi:hypothetical protein